MAYMEWMDHNSMPDVRERPLKLIIHPGLRANFVTSIVVSIALFQVHDWPSLYEKQS